MRIEVFIVLVLENKQLCIFVLEIIALLFLEGYQLFYTPNIEHFFVVNT